MDSACDWLSEYLQQVVVCDLKDGFMVFGTLVEVGTDHLSLTDCDLHDQREANSTKDVYAIETRSIGIRANRTRCSIPRRMLVAISRLDEVRP